MAAQKKQGRKRMELVAEPEWIDLVAQAATAQGYGAVAAFVRVAVNEKLRALGYSPAEEAARPRGRPSGKRA